jgi:tRNA threonylcarbamoyladenosine biosynthesis protein TsaE
MELLNKTYVLDELPGIARELIAHLDKHRVVTFEGELGAGKTTLISALCKALGVEDTVGSPTFSLVNQYQLADGMQPSCIFHIDLYRLSGEEEAVQAGIEEHLFSGQLCFVEWPQRAPGILPSDPLRVRLSSPDPAHRHIAVFCDEN